jgi:putative ABC transport system permease protein
MASCSILCPIHSGINWLRFTPARRALHNRSSSIPIFSTGQRNNRSLDSIATYHSDDFNLTGFGGPERVRTEMISADFFSILGVTPIIGPDFVAQDDHAGAAPVVIRTDGRQMKLGENAG